MNSGKMVFSQVVARVPHWEFQRLARAHDKADGRRQFSAWDHFLALVFAQMTFRESLRDIEACLSTQQGLGYHLGFRSRVTRSTLARANEERSWQLFAALAQKLIRRARRLYQDEPTVLELAAPVYAVDSTLIDLSVALCPWANWTGSDAAVKLHASLDLRGPLPAFVAITEAGHGDVVWLDDLPIEPGSYYVMDRGYIDFRRLRRIAEAGAFFVVRDRPDVRYYVAASRPVDRNTQLRSDQSIRFNGTESSRHWPDLMRRVSLYDAEHSLRLAFWTNQWTLSAALIAELYRLRWQIELFFRWVKHGLRIRTFYGTTPNAIRVQLWSAICTYLAIAITRKELRLTTNLTTFVQVLSVHAFSKTPIDELFAELYTSEAEVNTGDQLTFNNL
jgi:transposase